MSSPLEKWVEETERLTKPDRVVWCDGSEQEHERLVEQSVADGTFLKLNLKTYPDCYLHRSDPSDVARTEQVTFICTSSQADAGPTNNWLSPAEARQRIGPLLQGAMKGRTMFVIPYLMGPAASPTSKVGVEITDSPYVVTSMRVMTRMGQVAMERLGKTDDFVPGLHSLGDLNPSRRFIAHFPEEKLIWSVGSGYGGNALLGKKCFALRIASYMARNEGWMAEHMLILGLEDPSGKVTYMAAAFPSACGKTNLAMMVSALEKNGYRVWTVGDDIAWMRVGADGYLHAINPEAGFFGVAPGTNKNTNPNVIAALRKHSIFTNVGITPENEPWWEGIGDGPPAGTRNWRGEASTKDNGPVAHPNSRYTVPARQASSISPHWEDPEGVPISAFIFGGRRARLAPLVYESRDWQHGVFVGATMASETTAAATGAVGITRRDPMAMLPFCGYHMGDYFRHWIRMQRSLSETPRIFHVNWFRKDKDGNFMWPGFSENMRVLKWIVDRARGRALACETPIGWVPHYEDIEWKGLEFSKENFEELQAFDRDAWRQEVVGHEELFIELHDRLPAETIYERELLICRL